MWQRRMLWWLLKGATELIPALVIYYKLKKQSVMWWAFDLSWCTDCILLYFKGARAHTHTILMERCCGVNRERQGKGIREGLSRRGQMAQGVQIRSWAARDVQESWADGRMRDPIKPYYHWYYCCHDHRNHTSDEAYYLKCYRLKDLGPTDGRVGRVKRKV